MLGNAASRNAYDSRRAYQPNQPSYDAVRSVAPPLSRPSEVLPNTISGQLVGAAFILLAGLAFLFLVKIYYIRFMWPIFVGAALVVVFGVWKAHKVMVLSRKTVASTHPLKTHIWIQEIAFWLMVCAGSYFIYLVMSLFKVEEIGFASSHWPPAFRLCRQSWLMTIVCKSYFSI